MFEITAAIGQSGLQPTTAAVWLSFGHDDSRGAIRAEGFGPTRIALSHPELARGFTPTTSLLSTKLRGRRDLRTRVGRALFPVSTSIRLNLLKINMEDLTNEQ